MGAGAGVLGPQYATTVSLQLAMRRVRGGVCQRGGGGSAVVELAGAVREVGDERARLGRRGTCTRTTRPCPIGTGGLETRLSGQPASVHVRPAVLRCSCEPGSALLPLLVTGLRNYLAVARWASF